MRRLALSFALLVAMFATTGGLAQARPDQQPSPAYIDGDQFCGADEANSRGTDEPDVEGWYPHRYNGLSDWLAGRDVPAEVAGKPSASASRPPDAAESGTLSSEPENSGALPEPIPTEVPPPPAPTVSAPTPTPAAPPPAPMPTPVPTPAPPRQPIPSGPPPARPNVLYSYYDVSGTTYAEVQEQASKNGPADGQGNHWAGSTNWSLSWKATAMPDGRLTNVQISYSVKVTLPRWTPPADAADEDVSQWSTYMEKLIQHENTHVDNVVNAVPEVAAMLQSANKASAQAVFDAQFKAISQRQDEWDATTNHGLN